jgi:hypothetical protein
MSHETEINETENTLIPWDNKEGISLALSPADNESVRKIAYGTNLIGMKILPIWSDRDGRWPVISTPTLSDLSTFKKALEKTVIDDPKIKKIIEDAQTAVKRGIKKLQKPEKLYY